MSITLAVKIAATLLIIAVGAMVCFIPYLADIKGAVPCALGLIAALSISLIVMNHGEKKLGKSSQEQEQGEITYIATSEDLVLIDLSKSNSAELGIILGDSPVSDYADGFIFSYLDMDGNVLDDSPVKVTGVKAGKKNGWCTATVSARKEGVCYVRVSHRLATYSTTDVLVVVTAGKNI